MEAGGGGARRRQLAAASRLAGWAAARTAVKMGAWGESEENFFFLEGIGRGDGWSGGVSGGLMNLGRVCGPAVREGRWAAQFFGLKERL